MNAWRRPSSCRSTVTRARLDVHPDVVQHGLSLYTPDEYSASMAELTQTEAVVLAALSDRPRYGYELVQRVAELTDDRVLIRQGICTECCTGWWSGSW